MTQTLNAIFQHLMDKGPFELMSLIDDGELKIKVRCGTQELIQFAFLTNTSYRRIDESVAFRTLENIIIENVVDKCFFEVNDSEYIKWFNEESFESALREVKHFLLFLNNDVIDVLSTSEPEAYFVKD